jgi:hypothetical protein
LTRKGGASIAAIRFEFAAILSVLDRVFGRLYLPKTCPSVHGINAPLNPTLASQLLDPLAAPLPVAKPLV